MAYLFFWSYHFIEYSLTALSGKHFKAAHWKLVGQFLIKSFILNTAMKKPTTVLKGTCIIYWNYDFLCHLPFSLASYQKLIKKEYHVFIKNNGNC